MSLFWLFFLIMLVCVALLWESGIWGSSIALINVTFASMLATNYFEPLADWLDSNMPSFTYFWDFLALWLLFAIFYAALWTATFFLSRHKVRFKLWLDAPGAVFFSAWAAWVLVCFTYTTLHTAPLPLNAFNNTMPVPPAVKPVVKELKQKEIPLGNPAYRESFGTFSGDVNWLGFIESRSRGALAARHFDPQGSFFVKYALRRARLQEHREKPKEQGGGTFRVRKGDS